MYGWPQDGIDAVLTTLLASNHLSAKLNGSPLSLGEVDQKKLGQAAFRIESPVLTAVQKLAIRKLFQEAGLSKATPGNEPADAIRFIEYAKTIAAQAGGDAPAPHSPAAPEIIALESLSGNDLLMALYNQRDAILAKIKAWQATGKEVAKRLPAFGVSEKLVAQATVVPGRPSGRPPLLPFAPIVRCWTIPIRSRTSSKRSANALRAKLAEAHKSYVDMYASQNSRIGSQPAWQKLSEEKRKSLLSIAGALQRTAPTTGSDEQLLAALQSSSLATWQAQTDALPAQFDKALSAAIVEAEPKARRITLSAATIHDQAELDAWLNKSKTAIEAALKDGPVIL